MTIKKHNFSGGPSILPQEVFKQAAEAVLDLNKSGLSLLEISHRSVAFTKIIEETIALTRELLSVPDNYDILFLQGGASSQFGMVPYNLLDNGEKAGYINTGVWSTKAIADAKKLFGDRILEVASSADKEFSYIPSYKEDELELTYLHYTTNNTIYGTEYHHIPNSQFPLVADMSSNIFSRPIDVSKFALIYAGAQKNLGPAGATLVILKKDVLKKTKKDIPVIWSYDAHISKKSVYNTPPVFAIYVCLLTLRWLKENGGLEEMDKRNEAKAKLLYEEIDRNSVFENTVEVSSRSRMNVGFRIRHELQPRASDGKHAMQSRASDDFESKFFSYCASRNIVNIKGHRTTGGFRASLYNALPIESVKVLVEAMKEFEAICD